MNTVSMTRLFRKRIFAFACLCSIAFIAIFFLTKSVWAADLPDLVMTAVSGPTSANTEQQITVANTARNQGLGAAGPFWVYLYLSTDATITTSDIYLVGRYIGNLAAGTESTVNTTVTIPSSVASGTYYIGAIADSSSIVVESDETNNALAGSPITVTKVYPDLVMTSVSGPTSANTEQQITVANTVKNQGLGAAGPFWVYLYLSTDATITTSDIYLVGRYIGNLAAGTESTVNTTVTIPSSVASGTYYIGAIADSSSIVVESDETNNALAGNQITIGLDTTPPTVTITSPVAGFTNNKTPTLTYTVSDGTVKVKVDGVVVSKVSGNNLDPLADGLHTVRVESTDAAGNIGFAEAVFTVDTIAPTVSVTSPTTVTTRDNTLLLAYTASDGAVAVKVDGTLVSKVSGDSLDALVDGPHTVRVEAMDTAGNTGFAEVTFAVDSLAPLAFSSVAASTNTINTAASETSTIFFTLNGPATATLKIIPETLGPTGTPVYQATKTIVAAGAQMFTWNGKNSAGQVVPDEAYLYILEATDGVTTAVYSPAQPTGTGSVSCTQETSYNTYKNDPLSITYSVTQPARIDISIAWPTDPFKVMTSAPHAPGNYTFNWDGRDTTGNILGGGGKAYCYTASLLSENYIIATGNTPKISQVKTDPYQADLSYGVFIKIKYSLSRDATVTVQVKSPSGSTITIIGSQAQTAGSHEIEWTGLDASDTTGKKTIISEEGDYTVVIQATNPVSGTSSTARANLSITY